MKRTEAVAYEAIPFEREDVFISYKILARGKPYSVILESGQRGDYTIVGLDPDAVLKGKNGKLSITQNGVVTTIEGDVLSSMKMFMGQFDETPISGLPDFQGGAVGYLSYDYVREIEELPSLSTDDLEMPDLYFAVYRDVFVYDHQAEKFFLIARADTLKQAEEKAAAYKAMWLDASSLVEPANGEPNPLPANHSLSVSMDEAAFMNAVEAVQEYIRSGDVFQVNLSVRQTQPLLTEPLAIYEELRKLNPSPYMGYLHFPEFQLVNGSPELLVKKKGSSVSTRPIAGTRSRGKTEEEDFSLASELINNEKERAEHVMLVDLERNDLGKVCRYGTVTVDEFMTIERYSHVMHIVSNVTGQLAGGYDGYDLIRAAFPGGTITGAPKVRTMEIIEELEPVRRGVYTGSIGWVGFSGDLEMNITIRTLVAKDGQAHVQAGAGIVIDSHPKHEYKESLKKAKALWTAKQQSEQQERGIGL
ncbi:aminodeoxychorismate synthase, component I [Bacillus marinisedimentorum]|uniref:aminodeoxychorismate synthase, component I n=1 Tax=Bacillus marinisedimentorum TaxID=1821260 RepID=UPI0007DFC6CC|nr:aminodeoxychorismate synthase, component I [Bacillus marinisedimentorum]